MKSIWLKILSIFFIFLGVGFLSFVVRMIWFPPSSSGMMMGKEMMLHHVFFMFILIFLFTIIYLGIYGVIWMIKDKKNK
ncbi:hypothetical protein [Bacillus sp. T3]|uniref:hypothetical protein n=1 Tax=Bacillus sp. T3 TaxID=467262 RepID=UPI002980F1CE|nr:hypothetical protein [Bacillus sp. T3]